MYNSIENHKEKLEQIVSSERWKTHDEKKFEF